MQSLYGFIKSANEWDFSFKTLKSIQNFYIPQTENVNWGIESIRNLGSKIWETITCHIKASTTLDLFKAAIKQ